MIRDLAAAALRDPVAFILGTAGVLLALGVIGKAVRAGYRWCRAGVRRGRLVFDLVERELDHNHGSSMKDDLTGIAVAVGKLQRVVEEHHLENRRGLRALNDRIDHHHPPEENDDGS